MWFIVLFIVGCLSGLLLFRKHTVAVHRPSAPLRDKVSVIIPARNEEENLPDLLRSLREQTLPPAEIIVVDDCSDDRTKAVAESFGVTVIESADLPQGWTGKNWAVWNGYLRSSGDVIAFLDADVRLAPHALEALLRTRAQCAGAISVVPFHHTRRWHEKLALIPNILGVFAFTSPFEKNNPGKGLYGSCIVTAREDYEKISGHDGIRSELLDDLNLGAKYRQAGIPVTNFLGRGLVSFRMYPSGIRSELQGFGKGAVLSTSTLHPVTVLLVSVWFAGLLVSESAFFLWHTSWAWPMAFGYILYMIEIFYLIRHVGRFGAVMPVLHILSSLFFVLVMLYSAYQVVFLGRVVWKGRHIQVGSGKER